MHMSIMTRVIGACLSDLSCQTGEAKGVADHHCALELAPWLETSSPSPQFIEKRRKGSGESREIGEGHVAAGAASLRYLPDGCRTQRSTL